MKVLFDYQIFALQKYGGISRYFFELINNFVQKSDMEIEFPLYFSNNENIKSASFSKHKTFFPNLSLGIKNRITKSLNQKNVKICSDIISQKKYDVFHPTYFEPYFLDKLGNKPFVLTIHDMTYEVYPELFAKNDKTPEFKKLLANKSSKIITISQSTKKDISKFYDIDESKIIVTHLANSIYSNNFSIPHNISLPEKYILYVGGRKAYKNFNLFLKSVKKVFQEYEDVYLLCAGGGELSKEEKYLINELGLTHRVKYFSINDHLLPYFYQNAIAFIFPSLYEGFGIPILEAFNCNCPVLLSNVSSFPEVAGSAALYFDPKSIISMKESIVKIIEDKELRQKLINTGLEKLKEYSWEKTAEQTKEVYKGVL